MLVLSKVMRFEWGPRMRAAAPHRKIATCAAVPPNWFTDGKAAPVDPAAPVAPACPTQVTASDAGWLVKEFSLLSISTETPSEFALSKNPLLVTPFSQLCKA